MGDANGDHDRRIGRHDGVDLLRLAGAPTIDLRRLILGGGTASADRRLSTFTVLTIWHQNTPPTTSMPNIAARQAEKAPNGTYVFTAHTGNVRWLADRGGAGLRERIAVRSRQVCDWPVC
jgi:hypothetical protein